MKKYIALLLSLCLLTSICCLTSFSADLSDYSAPTAGVASAFCDCLPENAEYNQVITFTVATDTNASKIKICRADGSVYAFANILAGFENYSDAGNVRTWNIEKRVEIPAPVNLKIYAGNCAFEYSSVTAEILSDNIPEPEGLWGKTAAEIVGMINAGWNLGNTLDSWGEWIDLYTDRTPERYETAWSNPVTTKAMIGGVKAGGFDLIRIPVTWAQHIDPDAYQIDPVWMAR
ncbi:MAG: cellulase family glycosylhydrolase, partial [Clostridia bacterium]|nr:cellulase family glycosylhydrolase [Clostridia bacterium]